MTALGTRPEAPARVRYDQLQVVPARHPGRWVATAVVAVLLAMVLNSLVTNPRWEWDVVGLYLTEESIVRGVLTELEQRAAARGYTRIHLTTGPRQPEAVALYLAAGYTPLFDPAVPRPTDTAALRALPVAQRLYAFDKQLPGDPS